MAFLRAFYTLLCLPLPAGRKGWRKTLLASFFRCPAGDPIQDAERWDPIREDSV